MDICERTLWRPGAWVDQIWWEQERVELAGARERVAAAVDGEEESGGEETSR